MSSVRVIFQTIKCRSTCSCCWRRYPVILYSLAGRVSVLKCMHLCRRPLHVGTTYFYIPSLSGLLVLRNAVYVFTVCFVEGFSSMDHRFGLHNVLSCHHLFVWLTIPCEWSVWPYSYNCMRKSINLLQKSLNSVMHKSKNVQLLWWWVFVDQDGARYVGCHLHAQPAQHHPVESLVSVST